MRKISLKQVHCYVMKAWLCQYSMSNSLRQRKQRFQLCKVSLIKKKEIVILRSLPRKSGIDCKWRWSYNLLVAFKVEWVLKETNYHFSITILSSIIANPSIVQQIWKYVSKKTYKYLVPPLAFWLYQTVLSNLIYFWFSLTPSITLW
jgi:hypothetical protein